MCFGGWRNLGFPPAEPGLCDRIACDEVMPLSSSTHASNCAFDLVFSFLPVTSNGTKSAGSTPRGWRGGKERVAIRRMNPKKLTAPGYLVQQTYLLQCLRLVHEFGALRSITIAYAMFPLRTQAAASAAAKRVLSNALNLGYLTYHIEPNSRRYYALTLRGGRILHSIDDRYRVRSTTSSLNLHRHEHREWCNVITLAARHRGLSSRSEAQIVGPAHSEIVHSFGHVPDAVTFYAESYDYRAAWHEVELSRRSASGTKKLRHLVRTLIEKRYLTHHNAEHNLTLVMHCATAKIERENRRVVGEALVACGAELMELDADAEPAYVAQVGTGALRWYFPIYINRLPANVEVAWSSSLPWPGAPGTVSSDVDVFLKQS